MSSPADATGKVLQGRRVAFVGKLASMSKREAAQTVRAHGAIVVEQPDVLTHLLVVGEGEWPLAEGAALEASFTEPVRQAAEQGTLQVLTETQLWQRLGIVEPQAEVHRLYTPAMLARLLGVAVAVIRRWHRRGLIVPVREVRRLPYFDFQEVAAARRLAELLSAGLSPRAIEKKLAVLARWLPGVQRPLAQLSVIVLGKEILLRQGEGLIEPGGQRRFDFEAWERDPVGLAGRPSQGAAAQAHPLPESIAAAVPAEQASSPEYLCRLAAELEEDGQLAAAAEMYRAAMASGGPSAEVCFQLAELLYRLGDLSAARERYYTAIELDEDYVEARANLGCVLSELGQHELAVAAFEGALKYHADYADVHYQLARTLDEIGRRQGAEEHWRAFLALAPENPWADEARTRLGGDLP